MLKVFAVEDEKSAPLSQGTVQHIPFEYTGKYLPYIGAYVLQNPNASAIIKASGISGRYGHEVGSWMRMKGLIEPYMISEENALRAQAIFRESEGIEVYFETAYAVAGTMNLAMKHKKKQQKANILFCLTGGRKI